MDPEVVSALRCPHCAAALEQQPHALRCASGHSFDLARQGYVNLIAGRPPGTGDSAAMVQARAAFLARGHFEPLARCLCDLAPKAAARQGLLVESGAGTGYYLRALLESMPERRGLALDLSKHAARRAARAHPRLSAAVIDVWKPLPLAGASAALLLDVFAPRNPDEFRRVLRPDGALILVTPLPSHLAELRAAVGLIAQDPLKPLRIARDLDPRFARARRQELSWTLRLSRAEAALLAGMGPSARHLSGEELQQRLARLPEPLGVTASVAIAVLRPLGTAADP